MAQLINKYNHLTLDERRNIYKWREEKISVDEIARRLDRDRSTIYREIRRNTFWHEDPFISGYYTHLNAEQLYLLRRQKNTKVELSKELTDFIIEKTRQDWSPEQISGYLKHQAKNGLYACPETIYRFIYSKKGHELELYKHLYRSRKYRTKKYGRRPRENRGIPDKMFIKNRPEKVAQRSEFGHWECDLIQFSRVFGKANITVLVERTSRYILLIKNDSRHAEVVMKNIFNDVQFMGCQNQVFKTITFDRGSEFLKPDLLQRGLGVKCYFCNPHEPCQKGY